MSEKTSKILIQLNSDKDFKETELNFLFSSLLEVVELEIKAKESGDSLKQVLAFLKSTDLGDSKIKKTESYKNFVISVDSVLDGERKKAIKKLTDNGNSNPNKSQKANG
jgi:hypothetical protein